MPRREFTPTFVVMLVYAAVAGGGCTTTVTPPRNPPDPVSVYLADYGRHSSLLLPDPRGHLTEYAFGDWDWFALRHTSSGDGVRALLFSRYATLGRRQLGVDDRDDAGDISKATQAAKVEQLQVSRSRVDTLLRRLDSFYDAHIDTVTYSPASNLWFVCYQGDYSACHNCNHATAGWLRELGCDVRGPVMLSKFVARAPSPAPSRSATSPTTAAARAGAKLENRVTYGRGGG